MAYTAKDLLTLFGAILNNDEIAKLEPTAELSEETFNAIKSSAEGLMTRDAVLNNAEIAEHFKKELYPVHKKSALSEVEQKLAPLAQKLGIDTSGKYAAEMVELLNDPIETALASKGDPKTKELLEAYKSDLEKLRQENQTIKETFESEKNELLQGFERKELLGAVKSNLSSYHWADQYDALAKSAIINELAKQIQSKAHLKLVDGQIGVFQKDLPEKELFNGNKKVTFQNLADEAVEPYRKKSEPVKSNVKVVEPQDPRLKARKQNRDQQLNRLKVT